MLLLAMNDEALSALVLTGIPFCLVAILFYILVRH